MNAQEYERLWLDSLLHQQDHAESLGLKTEDLVLYQGFVRNHYEQALIKMFPRLHEYWKPDWSEWSREYYRQYPPLSFELNHITFDFDAFLRGQGVVPEHVVELATYEILEFQVYTSQGQAPEREREQWWANPSLRVQEFRYAIGEWVFQAEANKRKLAGTPPLHSNSLAFTRHPESFLCQMTQLAPLDLLIIELLKESPKNTSELLSDFYKIDPELAQIPGQQIEAQLNYLHLQSVILRDSPPKKVL